ncbi:MAG: corrinoid ABC transporter substrate-binding protein [Methanobacterium sp. PtaU1.Bin097]|nr:MAG: corrinoid ABC transporter substrate-binding protein [Methanobacterium sp. PtaU1.Bin097]
MIIINRKIVIIIIIGILCLGGILYFFLGLEKVSSDTSTVSITDAANRTVQVPVQVNRVVGTGTSNRNIIYLNSSDKLVGVEQIESSSAGGWENQLPYMIANPELRNLPVIGDARKNLVNYEKIIELDPDVIFAGNPQQAVDIQNKTGIPTVVVYVGAVETPEQMDKYKESLKIMGKVLGKETRADELVNYIDSCQEDLANRTRNVSSNKTVYVGGQVYYGAHDITSTNPHYPPFTLLNANNIASVINTTANATSHAQIDREQLIKWNPDVIFIESGSLTSVMNDTSKHPEYNDLKAIQDGNVYEVLSCCYDKDIMFADAYYIGKILYPEQFSDVDPGEKANEIFMEFNGGSGGSVYDTFKTQFGEFKELDLRTL